MNALRARSSLPLSLFVATLGVSAQAAPPSFADAEIELETRSARYLERCPDEADFEQGFCVLTSVIPPADAGLFVAKRGTGLVEETGVVEVPVADNYANSTRYLDAGDYILYAMGFEFPEAGLPFTVEPGKITRIKTATLVVAAPRNVWFEVQSGPDIWVDVPGGTQCSEPIQWDSGFQGARAYALVPGTYTLDFGGELALNGDTTCNAAEFEVELEGGALNVVKRVQ